VRSVTEQEVPQVLKFGLREVSRHPDRVQEKVRAGNWISVWDLRKDEFQYWICPPRGKLSDVLPPELAAWEHQLPGLAAPPDSLGPPPAWVVRQVPEPQPEAGAA
jgi:hypothetical protein